VRTRKMMPLTPAEPPLWGKGPPCRRHGYDAWVMPGDADERLVARLLERDEDALGSVVARYGGVVFGVACRVVAEPTLAEEVAQDTFLALWGRPGAYDPTRGTLQAFLLGVARNKAIDLVRREQSVRKTKDALILEAEASAGVPAHESTVGFEERHEVRAALGELSDVQREAIVLAYFGGRTYREVAVELNIPEGTAKTRLRDGLIRLRELMTAGRSSEAG
jgi:RNA polymerase sigma-70 factor (ECF subfamily)